MSPAVTTSAPAIISDHIFFLATTKFEKLEQLNALAQDKHYPAIFLPITALGEPAPSPEEKTYSYANNMMTKCAAAATFFNRFSRDRAEEALKTLGFSPQRIQRAQLYGCAEDSGIAFEQKTNGNGHKHKNRHRDFTDVFFDTSANGPYTRDADREIIEGLRRFRNKADDGRDKPFPGTETIKVFGATGGISNFFRLVNLALPYAGLKKDPRNAELHEELRFYEESHIGAFPWTPGKKIDPFPSALDNITVTRDGTAWAIYDGMNPAVEETSYQHGIPKHKAREGEYVSREKLGIIYQPESRGIALEKTMKGLGVARVEGHGWNRYLEQRSYSLATTFEGQPYTVALAPDDGDYLLDDRRTRFAERCNAARMQLVDAETKLNKGGKQRLWERLKNFQQLLKDNDAFVLMPDPGNESLDLTRDLEKFLLLSYLAIHQQLDPEGKGKSIIVHNENSDWDAACTQFETMFNRGVYGDRPSKKFLKAGSDDEVMTLLDEARSKYRRVKVAPEATGPIPVLKDRTDKYNVCVFLSASLEGTYEDKAEYLGRRIQQENMGLVYGASDRNMMGGVYKGAMHYQNVTGKPATILGSSTRNILVQETEEGAKPEGIPDAHFYLAPNITARKQFFFRNSHAFVCLEGGVGTLDELLTYMWYKENNPKVVENKPMIISESAYTGDFIFRELINTYLGVDYGSLSKKDREAIYKEKGIIVLEPPARKLAGQKLYEMEMNAVMNLLNKHRAEHYPHLRPDTSHRPHHRLGSQAQDTRMGR